MKRKIKPDTATVHPILMGTKYQLGSPITDPQGSYTGIPEDPMEKPVQDADDL